MSSPGSDAHGVSVAASSARRSTPPTWPVWSWCSTAIRCSTGPVGVSAAPSCGPTPVRWSCAVSSPRSRASCSSPSACSSAMPGGAVRSCWVPPTSDGSFPSRWIAAACCAHACSSPPRSPRSPARCSGSSASRCSMRSDRPRVSRWSSPCPSRVRSSACSVSRSRSSSRRRHDSNDSVSGGRRFHSSSARALIAVAAASASTGSRPDWIDDAVTWSGPWGWAAYPISIAGRADALGTGGILAIVALAVLTSLAALAAARVRAPGSPPRASEFGPAPRRASARPCSWATPGRLASASGRAARRQVGRGGACDFPVRRTSW